jgi:hypothetical protein
MNIYRNTNWTGRNYDCTNVVYQVVAGDQKPCRFSGAAAPDGEWVKADRIPADMQDIGGFMGHTFYGYM